MSMIMSLKNAKFLKEGAKLKAFVFFKGRSIIYKDQGQILLLRLATDLREFGKWKLCQF
jgi:translation initiation factor IF-3